MQKRSSAPIPGLSRAAALERQGLGGTNPAKLVEWTMHRSSRGQFHCHEVLEIGCCRSGHGMFLIGDQTLQVGPGEAVMIPPMLPHTAYSLDGPSQWSYLFIDTRRLLAAHLDQRLHVPSHGLCLDHQEHPGLLRVAQALLREIRDRPRWWLESAASLTGELLVAAQRIHPHDGAVPQRSLPGIAALSPALRLIADQGHLSLPIGRLARSCGMSVSHLRRSFHQHIGSSPREYLLAQRIGMAAGMLAHGERSILAIGHAAGFPSLSSLNRQFRRRMGCSPRTYRQQCLSRS